MGKKREAYRQEQIAGEVELALGYGPICDRCGATILTFSDQCSANLLDRCPGFEAIEKVRAPIVKRIYKF